MRYHEEVRIHIFALGLLFALACGEQKPRCFECGLNDEWARAEAEERERAQREGEAVLDAGLDDAAIEPDASDAAAPADAGTPVDAGAPSELKKAVPKEKSGYESVWDDPDYCGTPNCGKGELRGPPRDSKP